MLCPRPPLELENRGLQYRSGFTASFANPQRSTWRNDTFNHQQQAIPDDHLKAQGALHCQTEVDRPHRPMRAPQLLSPPHHYDHTSFASLQSRKLPPLKKIVPALAPEHVFQQAQPRPNATLLSLLSSGMSDRRDSCAVDISRLLNPTDDKDPTKSGRVPQSFSATTVVMSGLTKPDVPTLTSAKRSPPHHMGLEAPYHQGQNFKRHDIDATPPQPAPPDDSTPKQTNRTEPVYGPFMEFTDQPRSSLFNPIPSSGHGSAYLQTSFDSNIFEGPSSSSTAQSQHHQIMMLDTAQGAIQIPVDMQAASQAADEKRKRNATASHNFRQRRKLREQKARENIDRLEAKIREIAEERDYYRKERDYFQNVAFYSHIPIESRPLSPKRRRHGWHNGTPLVVSSD